MRARGQREHPDFSFPQMQNPELIPPNWEPRFADYLYVSFTNATAFSPTRHDAHVPVGEDGDARAISSVAVTIALVISRAVGLFK